MHKLMLSAAVAVAFAMAIPVTFSTAASAEEVAGRPALPTTSVQDLIKMRDTWGTAPAK